MNDVICIGFRFVRIEPDGTVSYSQRLTLKADCPMQLQKFPFDSQAGSRMIGSKCLMWFVCIAWRETMGEESYCNLVLSA